MQFVARYVPFIRKNVFEYQILGFIPLPVIILNWIFQRILRHNSRAKMSVHFTSRVMRPERIKFHKDRNTLRSFMVSPGAYIQAVNGIELGKNFLFGPGLRIISSNHDPNDLTKSLKGTEPVRIGDNAWLGANVVILPGITIGDNCIIGAGAVVTKSFGDNVVIAGNPAKVLKERAVVENE